MKNLKNLTMALILMGTLTMIATTVWAAAATLPAIPAALLAGKHGQLLTIVEFSAPWCSSCQKLKPAVEQIEKELGSKLLFIPVNIDDAASQKYMKLYNLESVPSYFIYNAKGVGIENIQRGIDATELHQIVYTKLKTQK